MTLRQQVIHGLSWNFVSRLGSQLFQSAFSIVLARLLSPREFGIVGMLLVFTGFAQALADGGLSSALIHRQDATNVHRSTVFWMQLCAGTILSAVFFLSAPAIAAFYGIPALKPLSRMLSCVFFIQALGLVHNSLLMKEFRFKALAAATIGATLVSGIVAIALAEAGYGVWALAWQILIMASMTTLLLWLQSGWRPSLVFDPRAATDLGSYGIYLLGHGSLNYWLRNGANLLIGKAIGAQSLGIFSRAFTLMLLPLNNVSAVFGQVMFPALAREQHDIPRFRQHYLLATRLIALLTFPVMVGVAVLADPLILLLLGPKWIAVIPILRILALVGLFQSIISPVGWVFTALGETKAQFHLSILLAFLFAAFMAGGLHFGVIGVTYGYAGWALVTGILNLRLIGQYIQSSAPAILLSVLPIAVAAGAMGVLVYVLDAGPIHDWPFAGRLAAGFLAGSTFYAAFCAISRNETFAEFVRLLSQRFGWGRPVPHRAG
jgi:O-antigen/teichoic acid export membrane protein